ncbi:unnamed protein product, partial [Mesorhabditis belari]|uniref:G-protein coupled receptors family 1 profile domain-containing protein n=1 Tax=Mesorhabditis belari TaxID=2138241 RepID=A0AAF3EN68_9BILA
MLSDVVVIEDGSLADDPLLFPSDSFYHCNLSTLPSHHAAGDQTRLLILPSPKKILQVQDAISIIWWCNVVGVPLIAICGLAANLLNIAILTGNRAARRIPSWQLLLALAISDCFFLIFATLEVTPSSIPSLALNPLFNLIYAHSALYIRTLASTFYKSSVLIVVAFNVERYICVVDPLRSHRICTGSASRAAVATCVLISLLCSLQWPICYRVIRCLDHSNTHFYVIFLSDNPKLQLYYRILDYVSLIAFNILPICAVLAMNARLIITLSKVADEDAKRRSRQCGAATSLVQEPIEGNSAARINANAMLFAVVICLLICVGPQAPARLLFGLYGQYHSTAIVYTCATQLLVFLNASLNFCLYCVVSKRYRSLMKSTIKGLAQGVTERRFGGTSARSKSSSPHATLLEENPSRNPFQL